ncbi:MAG: AIR synthase family protein [Anaerolineae bacterium]|nr:AIR synthase family protein [Anaerolineae bacterium]
MAVFPLGKLPPDVLADLLARYPISDPRVIVGPRPGEDASVLDVGADTYLVAKSDPITFATEEIGWYAVNVNANDIATTGGQPAWFMAVLLLPEGKTNRALVDKIYDQIAGACDALGATLIGGHTEITYGIDRPIIAGTMLGFVEKDRLVHTGSVQPGDSVIVTKGVPIEATAIIASEKADELRQTLPDEFVKRCAGYLHSPGISVVKDARIAMRSGRVHAMHDPTEGGLATALWEMADASQKQLVVDPSPAVLTDGKVLCEAFGLNPLGAIASGALLMAVHPDDSAAVIAALAGENIAAFEIGRVQDASPAVIDAATGHLITRPARDEIARLFE